LQDYVQDSIAAFTSRPEFASALGLAPEIVKQATLNVLLPRSPPPLVSLPTTTTPELTSLPTQHQNTTHSNQTHDFLLEFRHDCLHVGCSDLHCQLCTYAQKRHCSKNFCAKYLVGDALKAECGAPIFVQALDKVSGRPVSPSALQGVELNAILLNQKHLQLILESKGGQMTSRDFESAAKPTHLGKYLLDTIVSVQEHHKSDAAALAPLAGPAALTAITAGRSAAATEPSNSIKHTPTGHAILTFDCSKATISGLMVTGSSEAILSGQRPQFVLLVQAVNAVNNTPVQPEAPLVLSDGFVVATARTRSSTKKIIPHLNDDVSKLNSVGKATVGKLKDLRKAAIEGGHPTLDLPLLQVNTVDEFRQLADWASRNQQRTDTMKKILKLNTGWEAAGEHAAMAVHDDSCLRGWWVPSLLVDHTNKQYALVYAADKGVPFLSQGPIALLEMNQGPRTIGSGGVLKALVKPKRSPGITSRHWSLETPPSAAAVAVSPYPSAHTIHAATTAWYQPQHPGWFRFPLPLTTELLRSHLAIDTSTQQRNQPQPQQPQAQQRQFDISSEVLANCYQYSGRVMQQQRQQSLPSLLVNTIVPAHAHASAPLQPVRAPSLPEVPPLIIPPAPAENEEIAPPFSSMLQSFPSIPHPDLFSRLLSSRPGLDFEQAAAAEGAAAGSGGDVLLPAVGGSGNSSSLFRGLSHDWNRPNSLNAQEWQQLLALADQPPSEAAAATGLEPAHQPSLIRCVSAAKSIFSGKLNDPSSPFTTAFPSQAPLPPLPPLPPVSPAPSGQQQQQKKQVQEEDMLGDEPSFKLMLSADEQGVDPSLKGDLAVKKRQTDDREAAPDGENSDTTPTKVVKQRRLTLP
jgi:hypothetical protein